MKGTESNFVQPDAWNICVVLEEFSFDIIVINTEEFAYIIYIQTNHNIVHGRIKNETHNSFRIQEILTQVYSTTINKRECDHNNKIK